jgi:hypothetical protein
VFGGATMNESTVAGDSRIHVKRLNTAIDQRFLHHHFPNQRGGSLRQIDEQFQISDYESRLGGDLIINEEDDEVRFKSIIKIEEDSHSEHNEKGDKDLTSSHD